MIVAHHMGEQFAPMLVVGATAAPALLILARAQLGRLGRALRRPRLHHPHHPTERGTTR
jgi:hypothetical protein